MTFTGNEEPGSVDGPETSRRSLGSVSHNFAIFDIERGVSLIVHPCSFNVVAGLCHP